MATAAVQQPIHQSFGNEFRHTDSAPIIATELKKIEKHDVQTTLNFHKDNEDGSPPAPTYVGKPETYERAVDTHNVTIHDVSGDEDKYTLDSHGFQFVPSVSVEKDFNDEEQIKDRYYKEVDQLLKDVTGASRTFIFDHTIRRAVQDNRTSATGKDDNSSTEDEEAAARFKAALRGPVRRVHIDQSYPAALSRVPHHLPDEAEKLLKGRVQLINVWRPIKIVRRDPLTVARAQTVVEEDLVPIGLIYEVRKGETLAVRHNENHQWFYKYRQTPEEALLIKCFDNKAGVGSDAKYQDRAKRVPHSAFEVPGTEDEEGRESIEVRALVFHEDDVE
ncbi:hypothetical protein CERZMDRAFT_93020 [Cercospora zeae-maydis SCOH1-5]|uniref:Methyltransferase n=1 Tax=Cercospora zeae-maydis SCOH1-5 TaxID=717836 RepID=A0A6A6FUE9_9PEZI|nr:hypothetical protein CERZMDRAFT_93020 [Cercospora zeae-maydis SCOH1-5]